MLWSSWGSEFEFYSQVLLICFCLQYSVFTAVIQYDLFDSDVIIHENSFDP